MIAFDLQCANGHTFEGWFDDSRTYEEQKEKGLIACPVCDDTGVSRIPSRFAIKSSQPVVAPPAPREPHVDMEVLTRKVVEYVEKNFDNVGADFTTEALKIHYGVSEPRNIRGVSTSEEEKTLKKEGIQYFKIPIPVPPDSES